MSISQSLDIGEELEKKEVFITPVDKERVKEYDEARQEISNIPKIEFEKPKKQKKEIPGIAYIIILFAIIATLAWFFYEPPKILPQKNATLLAELLKQGLL